jgi:GntR family transcriptional regulator
MAEPRYRQIAADLRRLIESGALAGGDRLPAETELQDRYESSRNTVRDALRLLVALGLAETRPGAGTFVRVKMDPIVTALGPGTDEDDAIVVLAAPHGRDVTFSSPQIRLVEASELVAGELRLPPGSVVACRQVRRLIDRLPWSVQTSFYPMSLVERGATRLIQPDPMPGRLSAYLRQTVGVTEGRHAETLAVRVPTDDEASFFALPDDGRVPITLISATCYDQSDEPFRRSETAYPADRTCFELTTGRVP